MTITTLTLREMIRQRADQMRGAFSRPLAMDAFLAEKGQAFTPQALPAWMARGTPKECFSNAANLVIDGAAPFYAEGYAMRPDIGLPIHHAWAADSEGRVIDPTWDAPEDCLYLGVQIERAPLIRALMDLEVYGILDQGLGFNARLVEEFFDWTYEGAAA